MPPTLWRLKKGLDRRFRSGHPWVYSNELAESPKGIEPGAPVELQDPGGTFLARGYGNPASLIAFRTVSRDPELADPLSADALLAKLGAAAKFRQALGLEGTSHRLCFGEADGLPGLIVDRYRLDAAQRPEMLVLQAHTAGMDRLLPRLLEVLPKLPGLDKAGIIIRNDVGVRRLEGLEEQSARVVREVQGVKLEAARILVGPEKTPFEVDLLEGQKTGFFLDQWANVQLAITRLAPHLGDKVRILDLCCYAGQWSAQFARALKQRSARVEVLAVDSSAKALEFAKKNIEAQGGRCETTKADVLKDLGGLPDHSFDLVISDPPALIKGRKDIPQGTHAYLQLNTQALRLVRKGGGVVACSCSNLLEEEKFLDTLAKAGMRNRSHVRWIARGAQAPDHPILAEFPEGRYLKAWIGVTS